MYNQTVASLDIFIPDQWGSLIRRARASKFVLANLVYRYPLEGRKGRVFHIPNLSNLTASDKLPNQQVTLVYTNENEFTLTINKHKEISMLVEDAASLQEDYNVQAEYQDKMGLALAQAVDDDLLALRSSVTNSIASGSTGITEAKILAAMQTLDEADVPSEGRVLVVPPAGMADLRAIDRFTSADRIGNGNAIRTGNVGTLYGCEVYMTNRIKAADNGLPGAGGGTAATYYSLLMHKEAMMLGMQMSMRFRTSYELRDIGMLMVADEIYGVGLYRDDHAVVIQSV